MDMRFVGALLLAAAWTPVALAADAHMAQGVLRGDEQVQLSSEMPGKILRIADDGDRFRKGDTLVEFACDVQRAEEEMAVAAVSGAKAQAENQRRLVALETGGSLDLALAEAHFAEAAARERGNAAKARLCKVIAPYDGIVLKREARAFESVNLMAPLLRVARQGSLEVVVIAPARWLREVKVGMPLTFIPSGGGEPSTGEVISLGAGVDPSSQTFELRGRLKTGSTAVLRPGLSGSVALQVPNERSDP